MPSSVTMRPGDVADALEVVVGAAAGLVEDHLLGHPAAEQPGELIGHDRPGHQAAFLGVQAPSGPQRPAPRDDGQVVGDPLVGDPRALEQAADDRVAGLVVRPVARTFSSGERARRFRSRSLIHNLRA